jgi:hypothetical protein
LLNDYRLNDYRLNDYRLKGGRLRARLTVAPRPEVSRRGSRS